MLAAVAERNPYTLALENFDSAADVLEPPRIFVK